MIPEFKDIADPYKSSNGDGTRIWAIRLTEQNLTMTENALTVAGVECLWDDDALRHDGPSGALVLNSNDEAEALNAFPGDWVVMDRRGEFDVVPEKFFRERFVKIYINGS